jgi:hypothetical protein
MAKLIINVWACFKFTFNGQFSSTSFKAKVLMSGLMIWLSMRFKEKDYG